MFRLMERFCLTERIWILPLTFHCANLLSQSTKDRKHLLPVSIFNVLDVNVLVAFIKVPIALGPDEKNMTHDLVNIFFKLLLKNLL